MSINQYISHHAVIFKPTERVMWISTAPWQLGKMVKYDLNELFNLNRPATKNNYHDIPADSIQIAQNVRYVVEFREKSKALLTLTKLEQRVSNTFRDSYIALNPDFFQTFINLGDNYSSTGDNDSAREMYIKANSLKLPSRDTKMLIENKIDKLK